MKFNMSTGDNFASFIDKNNGTCVFVDSFDNEEFTVRIGTLNDTEIVGSITAKSNDELNDKLSALYKSYQGNK